jgi:N-acetylmuramoyl-L-alanine amidase
MAYYESSLLFASEVVDNLIATPLTPRKIVIDQDIFQVLVEANMPAVLLELAFVTNPTEYKYLSSETGQNQIADRLFRAFKSYKAKYDASVAVGLPDEQKPVSVTEARSKTQESSAGNEKTCYGIQIMGLARQLKCSDPAFKGFDVYSVKGKTSTIYKYIYGKYDTAAEARTSLPAIRKKFPEAFLVEVKGTEVKRVK